MPVEMGSAMLIAAAIATAASTQLPPAPIPKQPQRVSVGWGGVGV